MTEVTAAVTPKGVRRRGALVSAAAELLCEGGFEAVRHRAVARRAGLPLASTTYYFSSLDELVGNAVEFIAQLRQASDYATVPVGRRVLVIGGKPVPFCLARIPQGGEVRGNLAAGGVGVAQALTARDREIAQAIGPVLAARGLLLVGLDVIGESVTEINVTSPTCFQEITDQTGFDVASMYLDALESALG
jgi:AcrR family transcriptional regulator